MDGVSIVTFILLTLRTPYNCVIIDYLRCAQNKMCKEAQTLILVELKDIKDDSIKRYTYRQDLHLCV